MHSFSHFFASCLAVSIPFFTKVKYSKAPVSPCEQLRGISIKDFFLFTIVSKNSSAYAFASILILPFLIALLNTVNYFSNSISICQYI